MIPHGTPEWEQARLGKCTASRIADVTARTKSGYGASRANYLAELVAERLTGRAEEGYKSAAMIRGSIVEADAIAAYEFFRDATIEPGGFVAHKLIDMCGASPDGFIGADGLVEIKCPNTATHIAMVLGTASTKGSYVKQMMFQLAVTERQWCDFVSFDPRMPPEMQLHVERYQRDEELIATLEKEARKFLEEVHETHQALLNKRWGK